MAPASGSAPVIKFTINNGKDPWKFGLCAAFSVIVAQQNIKKNIMKTVEDAEPNMTATLTVT